MQDTGDRDDIVLARIAPSMPRRLFGMAVLLGLGALLLYLALGTPVQGMVLKLGLIALALGALWVASALYTATRHELQLTDAGLRDSTGVVIAPMAQIVRVDRGTFAFKPSNGFLLRLEKGAGGALWRPGLYWRFGGRVGVGGVAKAAETKQMADIIAVKLADRAAAEA
ncbi:hypothetical protein [Pseudooceanicola nanhaiensis]|uniref:hypothetical protein n=1 Tax=Pseudooceanicola nanhaiensis TaxID=375761 RepID=UPI001CD4F6F7|nr:hypothetical protein [Pseudooceanicola nanhaiensis]MCA0919713.1 hypothetical protein [Pseudooceanicola nanhaiensis]